MRYLETLSEPGTTERPNEDAIVLIQRDHVLLLAVIDGATERIPAQGLAALYAASDEKLNGASFAARVSRDALIAQAHLDEPRALMIAANDALRAQLESVYGAPLNPAAIVQQEPGLAAYRHDARYVRLLLPACVMSLLRVDLRTGRYDYAHAGDTAIMAFDEGGAVRFIAGSAGVPRTEGMFRLAEQIMAERALGSLAEAMRDERIVRRNRENALYHNYVDEQGQLVPGQGVGVIDGLPEFAAFIEVGSGTLTGVCGLLLCTDGLMWPVQMDENETETQNRLSHMRVLMESEGLQGYHKQLRGEESRDPQGDLYPRFKKHDDASGIYVCLCKQ